MLRSGCTAVAQVVRHWLITGESQVQSLVNEMEMGHVSVIVSSVFPLVFIFPPLLNTHLLRCAVAVIRQHISTSSVFKLRYGASIFLTQNMSGYIFMHCLMIHRLCGEASVFLFNDTCFLVTSSEPCWL
jgi:hypothetical protein